VGQGGKKGDSTWIIACRYGVRLSQIDESIIGNFLPCRKSEEKSRGGRVLMKTLRFNRWKNDESLANNNKRSQKVGRILTVEELFSNYKPTQGTQGVENTNKKTSLSYYLSEL